LKCRDLESEFVFLDKNISSTEVFYTTNSNVLVDMSSTQIVIIAILLRTQPLAGITKKPERNYRVAV
jgi:hypothetical protein